MIKKIKVRDFFHEGVSYSFDLDFDTGPYAEVNEDSVLIIEDVMLRKVLLIQGEFPIVPFFILLKAMCLNDQSGYVKKYFESADKSLFISINCFCEYENQIENNVYRVCIDKTGTTLFEKDGKSLKEVVTNFFNFAFEENLVKFLMESVVVDLEEKEQVDTLCEGLRFALKSIKHSGNKTTVYWFAKKILKIIGASYEGIQLQNDRLVFTKNDAAYEITESSKPMIALIACLFSASMNANVAVINGISSIVEDIKPLMDFIETDELIQVIFTVKKAHPDFRHYLTTTKSLLSC